MNLKLKKYIFYISLLPYAYVIVGSLYYAVFGYTYTSIGESIYGIEAFLVYIIHRFWFDNFIMFNLIGLFCTCCIVYQIWYFLSSKSRKTSLTSRLNIKKILFVISLISWIIYFLLGVYASFVGYKTGFFNTTTVYGLEAFKNAMFWNLLMFTYIPILPITLIYIIVYLSRQMIKRKANKKENG